jgi:phage N-6-adenine-methyltransferase
MPARYKSKQDYGTPWELIRAVEARFGRLEVDLAATGSDDDEGGNAKANRFVDSRRHDSLKLKWFPDHRYWLNPPFARIHPWAQKCAETELGATGRIFFLTPASVGARWWREHVHEKALVLFLHPRIVFEGMTDPFPKDCSIAVYGEPPGYEIWRWK